MHIFENLHSQILSQVLWGIASEQADQGRTFTELTF